MSKKTEWKEYTLKEDIIIPKGTKFMECAFAQQVNPYTATIGEGLKNSSITVTLYEETIKEMELLND